MQQIAVIAGDGIGREVVPEGLRVLEAAATRVWEAERACKRTGTPAESLCRSVLLGLAQRAAQQRRR